MTENERKQANKERKHTVYKERVKKLCEEKGYSAYELAFKSSVSMTTLSHIIDGSSTNPSLYTIVKICDGFGITLAEFFNTEEFENAIIESRDEK